MKFQRLKCPKLVRIEYNRIFLFQTGKFQYPSFTQNVIKSSLFAVGHLQKGRMVLSQLNNTKHEKSASPVSLVPSVCLKVVDLQSWSQVAKLATAVYIYSPATARHGPYTW